MIALSKWELDETALLVKHFLSETPESLLHIYLFTEREDSM